MDSGRFETFVDAILAIMMTVMILKIPQPSTLNLEGLWNLKMVYLSYFLSFMVLLSIWNHHRKLFEEIKEIDNLVIFIYMFLTFIITLLPYFTAWCALNPHELVPEICYGGVFILTNIAYVLAAYFAMKRDKYTEHPDLDLDKSTYLNFTVFFIGFILAILCNIPYAIFISCILSLIVWNFTAKFFSNEKGVGWCGN